MKFKRKKLKAFLFNLLAIAQLFVCPICNLFVTTCNLLLLFNVHDLFIIYYIYKTEFQRNYSSNSSLSRKIFFEQVTRTRGKKYILQKMLF